MRDLSGITTPELADQAMKETQEAIRKGEQAIIDGLPIANLDMVEELKKELDAIKQLKHDNGGNKRYPLASRAFAATMRRR